jgi:predicted AlkP superfamily phosphohydrolase/phosphomutase
MILLFRRFSLTLLVLLAASGVAHAYIGPGAGFVFISSFLVLALSTLLAVLALLALPFRLLIRRIRGRNTGTAAIQRVVVVGLDGFSPEIAEPLMDNGALPHLAALRKKGFYAPLATTNPPISPVAWTSFQTGVNPGKHNIFDFLSRDLRTYQPLLSFSEIHRPRRSLTIGNYRLPLTRAHISLRRKSKTFWSILGERGITSTVLRVPVTFPPEKFSGYMLSAMGAPDLKGTQGTFTHYSTRDLETEPSTAGVHLKVTRDRDRITSYIAGPDHPYRRDVRELRLPFSLELFPRERRAKLRVGGRRYVLQEGEYSEWIRFSFRVVPGVSLSGIGRFLIRRMEPEFDMYLTPINIDPERPAMPLSHPFIYSIYLSKLLGPYATLGEAEDTWALNEQVIEEKDFLTQCYLIYSEREKMCFEALKKTRKGVVVCVFDTPDRIQHMCWRPSGNHETEGAQHPDLPEAIDALYRRMDQLIGKVRAHLGEGDLLFILSDHGIKSFRRCLNLNTWLYRNGYLALKEGETGDENFFSRVDWAKTRAYGVGLAGLYVNQKGREAQGTVAAGPEKEALTRELMARLSGLKDEETGECAILSVYDHKDIYSGPYCENGPDLVIGCNEGYRISWESVTGAQSAHIFEDNRRSWKADHCVDTRLVPGVLFCSHPVASSAPEIIDLAPTLLHLFGVEPPRHMDGKVLKVLCQ